MMHEISPQERYRRLCEPEGAANSSSCDSAYKRFSQIKDILIKNKDEQGLGLLEDLVCKADRYIQSVVRMDLPASIKFRLETYEFQEKITEMDRNRRIKHEALISQLKIFNRYLFRNYQAGCEVPVGGIYSLPPETLSPMDRHAVGDWAGFLILGLYDNRKTD